MLYVCWLSHSTGETTNDGRQMLYHRHFKSNLQLPYTCRPCSLKCKSDLVLYGFIINCTKQTVCSPLTHATSFFSACSGTILLPILSEKKCGINFPSVLHHDTVPRHISAHFCNCRKTVPYSWKISKPC